MVTPLQTSSVLWDQPGLISPRVLVKGSKNAIVTIMNETNARIVVGKGVPLATIESIQNSEISSTMPNHNETMPKGTVNSVQNDSNILTPKLNENDFHVDTKDKSKPLELSGEMKGKLDQLLRDNQDLFAKSDLDLGKTHLVEVSLDTGDSPPIKQRPYRLPFTQWPMLDKHLDELLKAGIIRRSRSPWSSPILFVPRKDGGQPRMCVDYRKLNQVLIGNSYPLPNINDILASMQGATVFSVLDLKSGYYQLPLNPDDRSKTAFVCHRGLFEFNMLPFGLSTAPSAFQETIVLMLGDALNRYAIAYLDDIIIYSKTPEEHLYNIACAIFSCFALC